jgi:DNA (cytosine-5)-methyltransferase 1
MTLNKPPYRVPLMSEVRELPWNGFSAASTFSGCGGSSTGYRMAGFRILWASEFVEAARDSYRANMAPYTILDDRDIRTVSPDDILGAIGLKPGELDLLDGSPPCASFSTAGKRHAGWGEEKSYSDTRQRTDDLFFEFTRLLQGIQPRTFIAENVAGLIKGTAKGYFLSILEALKACGYQVEARLLNAQWLGVPQTRQRLIFAGVRADLGIKPAFPRPLPYCYTVRDALPHIKRHGTAPPFMVQAKTNFDINATLVDSGAAPSGAILANGAFHGTGYVEDFPPGALVNYDNLGFFNRGDITDRLAPPVTTESSGHFKVLVEPESDISRYAIGDEWDKTQQGQANARFFSLKKPHPDLPSQAVTAAGGQSLSAASVTHPTEKRKFTIAELKRICGFPDDFELTGTYAQQWERCGRAVPPMMMAHIAAAVRDGVLVKAAAERAAIASGPALFPMLSPTGAL